MEQIRSGCSMCQKNMFTFCQMYKIKEILKYSCAVGTDDNEKRREPHDTGKHERLVCQSCAWCRALRKHPVEIPSSDDKYVVLDFCFYVFNTIFCVIGRILLEFTWTSYVPVNVAILFVNEE